MTMSSNKYYARSTLLCFCLFHLWSAATMVAGFTAAPQAIGFFSRPNVLLASALEVSASTTTFTLGAADSNSQAVSTTSSSSSKSRVEIEDLLPWNWKNVCQEVWRLDMRPVIMFDGDCNLCNGGVNMLLDMDTSCKFRFCSLSSKFGQSLLVAHGKDPDDHNSILVISPSGTGYDANNNDIIRSKSLQKSEAVMQIARNLEGAPSWVKLGLSMGSLTPTIISNWLLQIVSDNRHKVSGDYDQCRLDFDGEYDGRFLNDYEHEEIFGH